MTPEEWEEVSMQHLAYKDAMEVEICATCTEDGTEEDVSGEEQDFVSSNQ
jgi:hypothetical protein